MTIRSPLSVEECVTRLREATTPEHLLKTIFAPSGTIIVRINRDSFRLRQKKSYNNSFSPIFYGAFQAVDGGTEISGDFRLLPFVRIFMLVWFSGVILIGGTLAVASAGQLISGQRTPGNPHPEIGILIPGLMVLFGFGLVKICRRLGESEKANMTRFLEEAFSTRASSTQFMSLPTSKVAAGSMLGPMIAFTILGLTSMAGSAAGFSSFHLAATAGTHSPAEWMSSRFHDPAARTLALLNGLVLLFTAYGIWRRLYIAWLTGFLVIIASAASFSFQVLGQEGPFSGLHPPLGVIAFSSVGAVVVGLYWAVWWYRKKDYFLGHEGP